METFAADPDFDQPAVAAAGFLAAKQGEEFQGNLLEPWTPDRKIAAQSMGMLYPLIGDAGWEQLETTGVYAGALKDVVIFLWLRVRIGEETSISALARAKRACRKPGEAAQAAMRWGESAGLLEMALPAFQEGYALFGACMNQEMAMKGTPAGEPGDDSAEKKSNSEPMVGLSDDGGGGEPA